VAKAIANQVGIDDYFAEALPEDKAKAVQRVRSVGGIVAMVGDGINDSPALKAADLGVAMGNGTDIAIDSADVVLSRGDISLVATMIDLSKAAVRNIHQNLFWAFFYNCVAIPVAAGVFAFAGITLNPMIAAACMSLSSLFVVSNALRLTRFANKKEIKERWDVLRDKRIDPFDTFDYQIELQKELKLKPLYFILCGDYNTNDKNISIRNKEFQKLIKRLGDYALVGIHPSFSSYLKKNVIKEEVSRLSEVLNREVTMSRQHFLRLSLPSTYQILIELDITDDYSMGYASQAGFRAGYADTFQFFDLENDMKTKLNIHPFALMDGTMRDYLDLDVHESYEKAKQLVDEVKNVNGTFILLWHNETLSGEKRWEGWITLYRKILDYIMN
jgi:predicted MPP superfamily phosphohydrolase